MKSGRKTILIAGLAMAFAGADVAEAATAWTVVAAESRVEFVGSQAGTPFRGRFQAFTAEIIFDPGDLAGSRVIVDIDIASARTGDPTKDAALPQAEWFNVRQYPKARFESQSFTHEQDDRYRVTGLLSIRDVTKTVVMPFSLAIHGNRADVRGVLPISRADFGVGQGPWAGSQAVAHEVTVEIDLAAVRGN
jgi:polyisoprenoid-binding protein YceI